MKTNSSIKPGDLLNVEQAAALATVKPSTIRAWLTQGRLSRVKLGRLTRIMKNDIETLIRRGIQQGVIEKRTADQSGQATEEMEQADARL